MSSTEQAPVPQIMPPQYFPDPCEIRKPLAFILSILSPIPGLEAIVWKCNSWGRVVAVTALLKVLFLILGIALTASGARPTSAYYATHPNIYRIGVWMIVVYCILSFANFIFTGFTWVTRTYDSLYVKDARERYARQERMKQSLQKEV